MRQMIAGQAHSTRGVVGLVMVTAALGALASAAQALSSDAPPSMEISYQGTATISFPGTDEDPKTREEVMGVHCSASDECVVSGWTLDSRDSIPLVREGPGVFSARLDGPGLQNCDDALYEQRIDPLTVSITLDEQSMTLRATFEGSSAQDEFTQCERFPRDITFVGAYVSGGLTGIHEEALVSVTPSATTSVPGSAIPDASATEPVLERELPVSQRQVEARAAVERGDRSVVPASVQTPGEAFGGGLVVALQNLVLASLLVLLMVFPAQLFNSTYDENHARVEAAVGRLVRRRRPGLAGEPPDPPLPEDAPAGETQVGRADRGSPYDPVAHVTGGSVWSRQIAVFGAVAAAGAVLGGLLDPRFGANTTSLALVLGVFLSVVVGAAVGGIATRGFRRTRKRPADWFLRAVPSGLVIAALCVLLSRLVHFQPGYLYGLVGGVTFAVALERREEGQAEALVFLAGALLAVVAWFGSSALGHLADATDPGLATLTADAFLAALFIGGIEGMLLSLVPLRFLPGHRVAQWSWPAWCTLAVLISFLFVHVLLRPDSGYLGRSPTTSVVVTVALFVAFGLASVMFWAYFKWRTAPGDSGKPGGQEGQLAGAAVSPH
jgi:hypothetical protein